MSDEDLHARLLAFLMDAFSREEHESCVRLVLFHAPGNDYKKEELDSWHPGNPAHAHLFDKEQRNLIFIEKLAGDILEKAGQYASTFFTPQKHAFIVQAHKPYAGYRPHRFVISPEFRGGSEELMVGGGEPGVGGSGFAPTQTGIISMLMKHIESKERGSMQKDQAIFGAMGHQLQKALEQITDQSEQIKQLLRERTEYMGMIEDAKSKEHERQIEAHVVTASEERKTSATKEIMRMAPVAISQWLGSGKGKGKNGAAGTSGKPPSPLAVAVSKLIGLLTNDQQVEIEELLSVKERVMLGEAMAIVDNGDSDLLPFIVHNLVTSLMADGPGRVAQLMALMRPEQRQLFLEAVTLAQAKAEPDAPTGPPGEVNGAPNTGPAAS